MSDLATEVLRKAAEKDALFKTTEVTKGIDVEVDPGHLLAVDLNKLDQGTFKSSDEQSLLDLARDNTQILLNRIWQLPTERVEEAVVAIMPPGKTLLPREKPIPKPKAPTKWETFAKMKGIQNKKKSRMEWDETAKEWKPTWGYKRANDDVKQWAVEVPQNADPYEDQFGKMKAARKERVAKNELQRMRNIARATKRKVPGVGITPVEKPSKDHLTAALSVAQKSDASMGKFSSRAPKEKVVKPRGKKRQFEANTISSAKEKASQLGILSSVLSSRPQVNTDRLANKAILQEQTKRNKDKQEASAAKKRAKGGGKKKGSSGSMKKGKGAHKGPAMKGKGKKR